MFLQYLAPSPTKPTLSLELRVWISCMKGNWDWMVILFGASLLILIVLYTSYLSYNNVEYFIRMKNDFLLQLGYPIGAAVNDSTQDQIMPLKK